MGTIWKLILIATIIFILLPIRAKRVSAQPMSQSIGQMQNVTGNMGGGTPTSSHPLPIGCCGQVSPYQQIPKPERKPDHNLRIKKNIVLIDASLVSPHLSKSKIKVVKPSACQRKWLLKKQPIEMRMSIVRNLLNFGKSCIAFSPIEQMR